jgi:hypothetical protein
MTTRDTINEEQAEAFEHGIAEAISVGDIDTAYALLSAAAHQDIDVEHNLKCCMDQADMLCPGCGEEKQPEDRICEDCQVYGEL